MTNETAYWITLAHLPKWGNFKINNLIIKFFHDNDISIVDFFELSENIWRSVYQLDEKQITDLIQAKSELPNNAFLAEQLQNQGFEVIPITSPEYSKILKTNLKATYSPPVLYIKGNKKLMQEQSVAIVGSRAASNDALNFTDKIAKKASKEYKVIVSGFAKGVDKQALDSAIKYNGQSIIVLPQGIMTFTSGFKNYYKQIINGDVLVLSTFHPNAGWSTGLAMARNPIIYGLASEIYVAESADKGGTWSGVIDGLRKGRKIYVRQPEANEKNANNLLIQKGAIKVDSNGNQVQPDYLTDDITESKLLVNEPTLSNSFEEELKSIFNGRPLTSNEIIKKLNLNWSTQKLTIRLKQIDFITVIKVKGKNVYQLKGESNLNQPSLFT